MTSARRLFELTVGRRNYLVEGVSGTGKTTVCTELGRRGYQGPPATGVPTDTASHEHHLWDVDRVWALVARRRPRHPAPPARRPPGVLVDATRPIGEVVDEILRLVERGA